MKFTVEVEDFYLEEGELAAELKHQIKQSVIAQIHTNVKKQVDEFMNEHIKNYIDAELKTRTQMLMDSFMESGKVKASYGSEEMLVKDWIAKTFSEKRSDIHSAIERQVKRHVEELQKRYDLLFATQLITKIKEQGFLKEDAAKLLLESDKPS